MFIRHCCAVGLLLPALLFSASALADDPIEDALAIPPSVDDLPTLFGYEEDSPAEDLFLPVSADSESTVFQEVDLAANLAAYGGGNLNEHNAKGGCCDAGCCYCSRFWIRGEYLLWWTDGMRIPPLVTTSLPGTPIGDQGVLGLATTRILLGNEELFNDVRSGGRLRLGWWGDDCQQCGIEVDYLRLEDEAFGFRRTCFDNPILDRPFFNVEPGLVGGPQQDAEIVCADGILQGAVTVSANTSFWTAGVRYRQNLCSFPTTCSDDPGRRKDFLLGYRVMRLSEDLSIREELNSVMAPVTNFDLLDRFDTSTTFHGAEVGILWDWQDDRWSLESILKVALGSSHHDVAISGRTLIAETGMPVVENPGGLLTQTSNIGRFEKNSFAVAPQFDLTLGYRVTEELRLTLGYSLLYLSSVVRPGDQVDLTVNGRFLDPALPFAGPMRPAFNFNESEYWAQGFNFGMELRL